MEIELHEIAIISQLCETKQELHSLQSWKFNPYRIARDGILKAGNDKEKSTGYCWLTDYLYYLPFPSTVPFAELELFG